MWLANVFGRLGFVALLLFTFIPLAWPLLVEWEGKLLPVVSDVQVTQQTVDDGAIPALKIWVSFDKTRQCDFLGLHWYDSHGVRVNLRFSNVQRRADGLDTRPTGRQAGGPWTLQGLDSLEGTRAIAVHRCHFLWNTYTQFY